MSIPTADKHYMLRNIGILVYKLNLGQLFCEIELDFVPDNAAKHTDNRFIIDYETLYEYYFRSGLT